MCRSWCLRATITCERSLRSTRCRSVRSCNVSEALYSARTCYIQWDTPLTRWQYDIKVDEATYYNVHWEMPVTKRLWNYLYLPCERPSFRPGVQNWRIGPGRALGIKKKKNCAKLFCSSDSPLWEHPKTNNNNNIEKKQVNCYQSNITHRQHRGLGSRVWLTSRGLCVCGGFPPGTQTKYFYISIFLYFVHQSLKFLLYSL